MIWLAPNLGCPTPALSPENLQTQIATSLSGRLGESLRNLSPKLTHPHEERIRMSSELVSQPELDWNDKAYLGLVSVFKDSPGKVMIRVRSWRRSRDQDALESSLAKIIETANGHQAKGAPKGSPVYLALCEKANTRIDAFCRKWAVDRSVIEAEAPNLKELYALCIPDKETPAAIKLLACFLAGILCLVLIGAASGLIHAGHDLIMHLISR
jgi:hypothetical protein